VAIWIRDPQTEFEEQTPLIQDVVEGFLYDKQSPREYTHGEPANNDRPDETPPEES
jgi:hypothetical protein